MLIRSRPLEVGHIDPHGELRITSWVARVLATWRWSRRASPCEAARQCWRRFQLDVAKDTQHTEETVKHGGTEQRRRAEKKDWFDGSGRVATRLTPTGSARVASRRPSNGSPSVRL